MLTENHDPATGGSQTIIGLLTAVIMALGAWINWLRAKISKHTGKPVTWEEAMRSSVKDAAREAVRKELVDSEDFHLYVRTVVGRYGDDRERETNRRLDAIERSQERMERQLRDLLESRS
jgi:hypothetical protein